MFLTIQCVSKRVINRDYLAILLQPRNDGIVQFGWVVFLIIRYARLYDIAIDNVETRCRLITRFSLYFALQFYSDDIARFGNIILLIIQRK